MVSNQENHNCQETTSFTSTLGSPSAPSYCVDGETVQLRVNGVQNGKPKRQLVESVLGICGVKKTVCAKFLRKSKALLVFPLLRFLLKSFLGVSFDALFLHAFCLNIIESVDSLFCTQNLPQAIGCLRLMIWCRHKNMDVLGFLTNSNS